MDHDLLRYDFIYWRMRDLPKESIQDDLNIDEATYLALESELASEIEHSRQIFQDSKKIGLEFMIKTGGLYADETEQAKGATRPSFQKEYDPQATLIDLPDPKDIKLAVNDLFTIINQRQTSRNYREDPLSLLELSYLLWCTQGVKSTLTNGLPSSTKLTVPSAGARHAFETYLLVNNVEGLEPGVYRFLGIEHKLLPVVSRPDFGERLTERCWDQPVIMTSAVTFIWSAVPFRMTWRFGERGYRYLHLDAGHVCQNLYLAAEAIDCGVCAISAFGDSLVNDLLEIDGEEEFVIYLATVGKKIQK